MNINEPEICNEYINGANIYTIYQKYKLGNSKIKRILKNNNINIRDGRVRVLSDTEKQQLCEKYSNGESLASITNTYKIDEVIVKRLLNENNIKLRNLKEANGLIKHKKRIWDTIDLDIAKKKYIDEKYSLTETAKFLGISPKTLKDFFIGNNIKVREGSEPENIRMERDIWSKYPIEEIIKRYNGGESIRFIKNSLNMNEGTIIRLLNRNKIKTRTIEEWHLTRKQWHKKYKLPSNKEVFIQGYEPQFLDFVFQNKLLTEEEIQFHPKGIKYFNNDTPHWYFPDFFIPKLNLITEVKSNWILERQTAYTQHLKEQATRAAGFDYILILDNDFSEFIHKYFKTTI